jgi:hypothetical protein
MPSKLWLAIVCFRISALIYIALGFLVFALLADEQTAVGVVGAMLCWGFGIGIEVVIWGLRQQSFWAWIAGLCLCGLYIPSLFLPLGALALWGLLDGESLTAFGVRRQAQTSVQ